MPDGSESSSEHYIDRLETELGQARVKIEQLDARIAELETENERRLIHIRNVEADVRRVGVPIITFEEQPEAAPKPDPSDALDGSPHGESKPHFAPHSDTRTHLEKSLDVFGKFIGVKPAAAPRTVQELLDWTTDGKPPTAAPMPGLHIIQPGEHGYRYCPYRDWYVALLEMLRPFVPFKPAAAPLHDPSVANASFHCPKCAFDCKTEGIFTAHLKCHEPAAPPQPGDIIGVIRKGSLEDKRVMLGLIRDEKSLQNCPSCKLITVKYVNRSSLCEDDERWTCSVCGFKYES